MIKKKNTVSLAVILACLMLVAFAGCAEEKGYEEGTHRGETEPDERGNKGQIDITITDGKITEADYVELQGDGTPKGEDYPYQTGIEAQPKYEQQLVKTQDPDNVDVIAGATSTHKKFVEAAKNALENAAK